MIRIAPNHMAAPIRKPGAKGAAGRRGGRLGGRRHAMRWFGHVRTRRIMLTGDRVPGPELSRLGIVGACVPADQLMPTAMALAAEIAAKSPVAVRLAKHALNTIEEYQLAMLALLAADTKLASARDKLAGKLVKACSGVPDAHEGGAGVRRATDSHSECPAPRCSEKHAAQRPPPRVDIVGPSPPVL